MRWTEARARARVLRLSSTPFPILADIVTKSRDACACTFRLAVKIEHET